MFKKIKELRNWKRKSVRVVEALIDLIPEEEWERMNNLEEMTPRLDIREMLLILARKARCAYSMEDSMFLSKVMWDSVKDSSALRARCRVLSFVQHDLLII